MCCKRIGLPAAICAVAAVASLTAWAQTVNTLPKRDDALNVRVDLFNKLVCGNHWNEGIILPMVIFPPAGHTAATVGQHQDTALETGLYLAALSRQYAVTKSPEVRTRADQVLEGILKLEKVTGEVGCVARSLYKADGPRWHEQVFSLPSAWHDSSSMEGYRWMGMLGTDQLTALIMGVANYWEFCADDAHRDIAAGFVDRVMGRCVENNLRVVDANGKTSIWGSFCPDLPHEPLKALLALADLRAASRLTNKMAYQTTFNRVMVRYRYGEEAILARDLSLKDAPGDTIAGLALEWIIRTDDNQDLVQKCRASLNRYWTVWRQGADPLFAMLYQALSGEKVVDNARLDAIRALWGGDRQHGTWTASAPDGPKTFEGDYENSPVRLLYTYWFGRHAGVIEAEW